MDKVNSRKSKMKRLTDEIKQKPPSSNVPARHIPQMSAAALKRWCEARDTYLGHRHPHVSRPRRIKPKKVKEPVSTILLEPQKTELPLEQQQQQLPEEHEHVDDKCVGTEIDESILFNTEIEHMDEATQADLPSPQVELQPEVDSEKKEEIPIDQESIEYDDKATETELIFNIKKDDEIDRESSEEIIIDSKPNVDENAIEPINDDDTKAILSSHKSELSIHEQLRRYFYYMSFFLFEII
jgi:hypothetical protein